MSVAFENSLGLAIVARHDDGVTVHVPIRPDLLNGQGVMHGGVIASIADEAAWNAIENHFGERARLTTTTELKVNYLRPLVGERVVARAFLLKAGKTLCVSRVDMSDDQGRLGAVAIVTYIVLSQSRVSAV